MVLAHNIYKITRTKDVQISQDVTFDSMLLSSYTLDGLKTAGFYRPSPIQLHGIPLGKCGFDILLDAKSGTGKTAVFSVIALEQLNLNNGLQVMILAPTREIAAQICDVIKQIGSKYEDLEVGVVMGGLPIKDDICKLKKKLHIIVGSPGRLRHLIQDRYIDTSAIRLLVLDEADKLMEKSFQGDVNYIFSALPPEKQVILSSATFPENTKYFINKYVQNAQHICPDTNSILLGIEQKISVIKYHSNIVKQTQYRFEELLQILTKIQFKQCLIFCNYQGRVAELYKMLKKENWPAEQLYGQQEQTERLEALKTLQEYKCRLLISTDLAARGIDASNIDLVINFEPPFQWQTYLHRIGRAGRYGSFGKAITLLSQEKEQKKFLIMIAALKDCLKLTHLWSDIDYDFSIEESNHLKSCDSSQQEKENEKPYLSKDTIRDNNEIESFDELCKSFDNYYLNNNEENVSQYSEISSIGSGLNQQISSKTQQIKNKKHQDSSTQMNNNCKIFDDTNNYSKLVEPIGQINMEVFPNKKPIKNNEIDLNQFSTDVLQSNSSILVNNKDTEVVKSTIKKSTNTLNEPLLINLFSNEKELENELRNAGLPTSFRSARDKYFTCKKKIENNKGPNLRYFYISEDNRNMNKDEQLNGQNGNGIDTNQKQSLKENKNSNAVKYSHFIDSLCDEQKLENLPQNAGLPNSFEHRQNKNNTYQKNGDFKKEVQKSNIDEKYNKVKDIDINNEVYETVKLTESKHKPIYTLCDLDSQKLHNSKEQRNRPHNKTIPQTTDECFSDGYINWYNQLKYKVKQIEISVYIKALTQINSNSAYM